MKKIKHNYHKPVLLREIIRGIIEISVKDVYVDATFGTGGHSAGLLKYLAPEATLLAFDQDQFAIENNTLQDPRLKTFNRNFRYIENILRIQGIFKVSGILVDLGASYHQIDSPERGFSIRFNQTLDMRMDMRTKKYAKDILNRYSHKSLEKVFFYYGDLKNAKKLATNIILNRKKKTVENTFELLEIIKNDIIGRSKQKFFAKVFQALRIEVNDELSSLKFLLKSILNILKKGGRIAVISYHRLEDRLVKQYLKNGSIENTTFEVFKKTRKKYFVLLSGKPISPREKEKQKNSRCRSAKLRIAKKK